MRFVQFKTTTHNPVWISLEHVTGMEPCRRGSATRIYTGAQYHDVQGKLSEVLELFKEDDDV